MVTIDTIERPEAVVVSMKAAREMLAIGKTKLGELCKDGQLDRPHIGRHAVVTAASIRAYVERLAG